MAAATALPEVDELSAIWGRLGEAGRQAVLAHFRAAALEQAVEAQFAGGVAAAAERARSVH